MDQRKELIRLALFGRPVKSSLSPPIQRMFAAQFGMDIEFLRIETGPEEFPDRLERFRLEGGSGCNITLPLKRVAWELAAQATPEVSQAQSANTLVYQPSSGWFAHNTDGLGLVTDLAENHAVEIANQRILILGAGGAAAGILGSLLAGKAREIVLVNRNLERAGLLAGRFKSFGNVDVTSWTDLPRSGSYDLVINATSLGHAGNAPPLERSSFAANAVCYDLNYDKASQPLKILCEAIGQRYMDGLGMLVEQAAKSFYIWTGQRPDSRVVIEACRQKLL